MVVTTKVKDVKLSSLTNATGLFEANWYQNRLITREGSATGPYIVCSQAHLNAIRNNLSSNYVLYRDIDLTNNAPTTIGGACGSATAFTGNFDGRGHPISNIGFTNADQKIFVKNLFGCQTKVKDVKLSSLTN